MISYKENRKYAYFNGLRFVRDDKTGYYLNSATMKRLHRYVYEFYNGAVPKGCCVHHKDYDKRNNNISNLGLLGAKKHLILHGVKNSLDPTWLEWARKNLREKARPKASEWHGSKKGREWHKKHYLEFKDRLRIREKKICTHCGKEYMGFFNNKFCSNKCKSAWRRKIGTDNEVRICEHCKQEFTTNKYSKQRHCSRSCGHKSLRLCKG